MHVTTNNGLQAAITARLPGEPLLPMRQLLSQAFVDVGNERLRQDVKWGEQNHPSFADVIDYPIADGDTCRAICQAHFERGEGNWAHILLEEVGEAMDERDNPLKLREELVQIAAVAIAWIGCLDRNAENYLQTQPS